jgi:hypothetical protein
MNGLLGEDLFVRVEGGARVVVALREHIDLCECDRHRKQNAPAGHTHLLSEAEGVLYEVCIHAIFRRIEGQS